MCQTKARAAHCGRTEEFSRRARVADEAVARVEEVALTQKAAGALRESGEPELPRKRQTRMRRYEPMRAIDPGFGRQVFEDEPRGRNRAFRHLRDIALG